MSRPKVEHCRQGHPMKEITSGRGPERLSRGRIRNYESANNAHATQPNYKASVTTKSTNRPGGNGSGSQRAERSTGQQLNESGREGHGMRLGIVSRAGQFRSGASTSHSRPYPTPPQRANARSGSGKVGPKATPTHRGDLRNGV